MDTKPSSSRSMPGRFYAVVRVTLLTGIVLYLGWQIISGWTAVRALAPRWDGLDFMGALASGLLAYQCLLGGWLVLLRRVGYFEARYLGLYGRIWWLSYLYRYVPGKVFLLVERARLGVAVGIPPAVGAALAIIETLLAILAAGWVSLLAVSYYAGHYTQLVGIVLLISIGVLIVLPIGYRLLCNWASLKNRYPELGSVDLRPRDVAVAMLPYILHFLLLGLSFFLCVRSLQLFSWTALPGLCGVYAFSHVVGLVTVIAPGGLGVREGTLSLQLSRMLPSGVAEVVALGARVWFTLVEVLAYATTLAICPKLPQAAGKQDANIAPEADAL